ncbi:MAG: hypothetical protein O2930_06400 [Acidobacteria bacterium]|nr:hypothetical protein [Acidobacteriota bacterium]
MQRTAVAVLVAAVLLAPADADAWGFDAHRFIVDRAVALLPDAIRPLFEAHRAEVVERSIDPDTWRTAGFDEESPNHFLNIDWEGFGAYPFDALPRDHSAAVAKFGVERITQTGTVPWRVEEMFGKLREAFNRYGRGNGSARSDVLLFAAWLAHYVSDAHVPFHAVVNHDGQLTGQRGMHARFESATFERYRDRLRIAPTPIAPVARPRDFTFAAVLEGTRLVPTILDADRRALGPGGAYDERYYDAFFQATRPVMERRLNESIAAVAAMVAGAWNAAGQPPVPATSTRPAQRGR